MKMKTIGLLAATVVAGLLAAQQARADFSLDGTSTAGWSVDRYAPSSFTSALTPGGQSALTLTVSSADDLNNRAAGYNTTFYNTQGFSQAVNGLSGAWSYSASLYISSAMLAGTAGPASDELWAGTSDGTPGNQSGFYIMGFTSGMDSRAYTASAVNSSQISLWDDTTGTWSYYSTAGLGLTADGLNQFNISYDGGSTVNFSVNGNIVGSQGSAITSQDPDVNNFTTAYLESYNYFGNGSAPESGTSTAQWTGVNAVTAVPEPSSVALAGLGGFFALFGVNRFRRSAA